MAIWQKCIRIQPETKEDRKCTEVKETGPQMAINSDRAALAGEYLHEISTLTWRFVKTTIGLRGNIRTARRTVSDILVAAQKTGRSRAKSGVSQGA